MMKLGWAKVGGSAAAVVLAAGALAGAVWTRPAAEAQAAPAQQQQGQRPSPAEIVRGLAQLAGVSEQGLRQAVQEHGSLRSALQALGVSDDQLLDFLAGFVMQRYQPAIDEGRLTLEQAQALAHQGARRLLERLNQFGNRS